MKAGFGDGQHGHVWVGRPGQSAASTLLTCITQALFRPLGMGGQIRDEALAYCPENPLPCNRILTLARATSRPS